MTDFRIQTAQDVLKQKPQKMITISHDQPIFEALQAMVKNKVGAILVTQEQDIVGIWSERDLLRNLLEPNFDIQRSIIREYMVFPVVSASVDTPLIKLQDMFLGLFIRHILIKQGERPIGLVSIGDVMRANMLSKDQEIKELNSIASWEYYENWGWHHKFTQKGKKPKGKE